MASSGSRRRKKKKGKGEKKKNNNKNNNMKENLRNGVPSPSYSPNSAPTTVQEAEIEKKQVKSEGEREETAAAKRRLRRKKTRAKQKKNQLQPPEVRSSVHVSLPLELQQWPEEWPEEEEEENPVPSKGAAVYNSEKTGNRYLNRAHCMSAETHDHAGVPDLVFVLHSTKNNGDVSRAYIIDTSGGDITLKLLFEFPQILGMHFVSYKSTLYAIGGDERFDTYPTDFLICDLSNWRDRDNFHWEFGPALTGCKPFPVLAAVDGKIYALAGYTCRREEIPEKSVFEVFDLGGDGGWKLLSPPPFSEYYSKFTGPPIEFKTVVGDNIYVGLVDPCALYSFNVVSQVWTHIHHGEVTCDPISTNLLKCRWVSSCEVTNNIMFDCRGGDGEDVRVYAWDLGAKVVEETPAEVVVEDEEFRESCSAPATSKGRDCDGGGYDSSCSSTVTHDDDDDDEVVEVDSDFLSWDEFASSEGHDIVSSDTDDYDLINPSRSGLCFPVRGLRAVTELVKKKNLHTTGFVVHLEKNTHCLVYIYPSPRLMALRVRVCTFQVVEQPKKPRLFFRAKILQSARYAFGDGSDFDCRFLGDRCKVYT